MLCLYIPEGKAEQTPPSLLFTTNVERGRNDSIKAPSSLTFPHLVLYNIRNDDDDDRGGTRDRVSLGVTERGGMATEAEAEVEAEGGGT